MTFQQELKDYLNSNIKRIKYDGNNIYFIFYEHNSIKYSFCIKSRDETYLKLIIYDKLLIRELIIFSIINVFDEHVKNTIDKYLNIIKLLNFINQYEYRYINDWIEFKIHNIICQVSFFGYISLILHNILNTIFETYKIQYTDIKQLKEIIKQHEFVEIEL